MTDELPAAAARVARRYPDLWSAYAGLGEACADAGPLDARTQRLIKLALAIGAASEGATHSHARRALKEGIAADELRQVALLAIPTLGFPRAVAALTWIDDLADED
jgi:alkylhydroperoxidase/carboxymuconolactone decarboxylase family protein YurZ